MEGVGRRERGKGYHYIVIIFLKVIISSLPLLLTPPGNDGQSFTQTLLPAATLVIMGPKGKHSEDDPVDQDIG